MISLEQAKKIVLEPFPKGKIKKVVSYKNLYVFHVLTGLEFEEDYDPFFSVDKSTGAFSDFSILDDGDPKTLEVLFLAAPESVG